jgi:hypothetical protein
MSNGFGVSPTIAIGDVIPDAPELPITYLSRPSSSHSPKPTNNIPIAINTSVAVAPESQHAASEATTDVETTTASISTIPQVAITLSTLTTAETIPAVLIAMVPSKANAAATERIDMDADRSAPIDVDASPVAAPEDRPGLTGILPRMCVDHSLFLLSTVNVSCG